MFSRLIRVEFVRAEECESANEPRKALPEPRSNRQNAEDMIKTSRKRNVCGEESFSGSVSTISAIECAFVLYVVQFLTRSGLKVTDAFKGCELRV